MQPFNALPAIVAAGSKDPYGILMFLWCSCWPSMWEISSPIISRTSPEAGWGWRPPPPAMELPPKEDSDNSAGLEPDAVEALELAADELLKSSMSCWGAAAGAWQQIFGDFVHEAIGRAFLAPRCPDTPSLDPHYQTYTLLLSPTRSSSSLTDRNSHS